MLRKCLVSAPSNIALIKYMGKEDAVLNLPTNPSLSMTLNHLRTWVEIECGHSVAGDISWVPEMPAHSEMSSRLPPSVPKLSGAGVERIVKHAHWVRNAVSEIFPAYGLVPAKHSSLQIKTANTFPAASGIASSASSFAAVTLATALISSEDMDSFKSLWKDKSIGPRFRRDLAQVSRQGSGSSCRSFEGPWVFWKDAIASPVESSLPDMTDLVVLISSDSKEISSSQAHAMVKSSPLWQGRVDRAQGRVR
ncbi:MAG: hypothetical protein ABI041_16165, partial [Bdellovibrionia bacterium]